MKSPYGLNRKRRKRIDLAGKHLRKGMLAVVESAFQSRDALAKLVGAFKAVTGK